MSESTYTPRVYVDPFPGVNGNERVKETCGKCGGSGYYNAPSGYSWSANGKRGTLCFDCNGAGFYSAKVSSVRARVRREVKRHNEAMEAMAAQALARPIYLLGDVIRQAQEKFASERKLSSTQWFGEEGGQIDVTGKVVVAMTVDGYAYGSTQRFIVLDVDGSSVVLYSSAKWAYEVDKGDEVSIFGATVKAHTIRNDQKQTKIAGRYRTEVTAVTV